MTDKAGLSVLLHQNGLGDYAEAILNYARPCVRLHARRVADPAALPLGSSRIGGLPDMPPGAQWPTRNGRLCEFVAQINLSEVASFDEQDLLPKEGMLLFFFDGREYEDDHDHYEKYQQGSTTIIYYTGDMATLERSASYPDSLDEWQRYHACSITFEADWMLPNGYTAAAGIIKRNISQQSRNDPETPQETAYMRLTRERIPKKDADKHHLFGYPEPIIQDDPLYYIIDLEYGQLIDEQMLAEWVLLLQISSDDEPDMLWADTSSLYYCIRKDDLLARQFDKTCCVLHFA